jgi:arylsulfatase
MKASDDRGRPDILIIIGDDIGYSDFGCYGGEIPTPNIDRIAANGIRFTQFHSAHPRGLPC